MSGDPVTRAERLGQAATMLADARRDVRVLPGLPAEVRPVDVEESYEVSDRLAEQLGWPIGGWYCAATNPAMQRVLGLDEPYCGRLFERLLFDEPATLDTAMFPPMVIEAEIAFRLERSLPPRTEPYTEGEVADAVQSVSGSIEVVASHLENWLEQDVFSVIADNGTDGALIVGAPVSAWRSLDLTDIAVEVGLNGSPQRTGNSASVLGNPLRAFTWLANERARRGDGLLAGHVHNTGTLIDPFPVAAGDSVVADFAGLGEVRLTLR